MECPFARGKGTHTRATPRTTNERTCNMGIARESYIADAIERNMGIVRESHIADAIHDLQKKIKHYEEATEELEKIQEEQHAHGMKDFPMHCDDPQASEAFHHKMKRIKSQVQQAKNKKNRAKSMMRIKAQLVINLTN